MSNVNKSITQVNLIANIPTGKKATVILEDDKLLAKPHFNMVGTGRIFMKDKRLPAVDLLKEIATMPTAASFALIELRDAIYYDTDLKQYTLLITYSQTHLTPYQKKQFKTGVKILIEKDLVRRKSRGVYMINPMALIPSQFAEAERLWTTTSK
jgi:hypothetical protein